MQEINISDLFDMAGWLLLAKEAEPLFGPMIESPEFFEGLRQALIDENAFCIRDEKNMDNCGLCGGIIISKENNSIIWFVVGSKFRNKGLGKKLMTEAMKHLDHSKPITVNTFEDTVQDGLPARRLYHKFGFRDSAKGKSNQAGIQTVIMTRQAMDSFT